MKYLDELAPTASFVDSRKDAFEIKNGEQELRCNIRNEKTAIRAAVERSDEEVPS
jgi:hypothetical protein